MMLFLYWLPTLLMPTLSMLPLASVARNAVRGLSSGPRAAFRVISSDDQR